MSFPPPRKLGGASIALLGVITLCMVLFAVRHDRLLREGQTLQFDDFFFTLERAERSAPLETEPSSSVEPMVRYFVALKVDNRAKRVPFVFRDKSLVIINPKDGRRFHVDPVEQQAHDEAQGSKLPDARFLKAGESATRQYFFRVPASVVTPRLRLAPGGWLGQTIDRLVTGLKEFQLP